MDNILDLSQRQEGLVASIKHQSDGEMENRVYAIGADPEERPPIRDGQWMRLMQGYAPSQVELPRGEEL